VSRVKEEADANEAKMGPPPASESDVSQLEYVDSEEDMLSMKFDEALPGGCAYTENDCALWEESHMETNTSDFCTKNCEVRPEVESHGRVVETINRHLLTTNLGKGDDDSSSNSIHSEGDETYYNKGLSLTTPDLVTDTQNRRNLSIGDEPNPNVIKADNPVSTTKLDNQNQNHIHPSDSDSAPQDNSLSLDKDAIGCSKIGFILNTINNALKEESLKEYKFSESEEPARVPLLNVFPRKECGSVHPVPKNTNVHGKERQPDVAGAQSIPPMIQRQQKMLTVTPPTKICITPPEPPPRPPPNPPLNQSKSNLSVSTSASTSGPSPMGPSSTGPSPTSGLRAIISKGSAPKGLFSSPKTARKKNPLLASKFHLTVQDQNKRVRLYVQFQPRFRVPELHSNAKIIKS